MASNVFQMVYSDISDVFLINECTRRATFQEEYYFMLNNSPSYLVKESNEYLSKIDFKEVCLVQWLSS